MIKETHFMQQNNEKKYQTNFPLIVALCPDMGHSWINVQCPGKRKLLRSESPKCTDIYFRNQLLNTFQHPFTLPTFKRGLTCSQNSHVTHAPHL